MNHLIQNNLVFPNQHGFAPQQSCLTQQIEVMNNWTNTIDNGGADDVILLDTKKAYDSVPHRHLLSKLKSNAFHVKVLKWIDSVLTDRIQRVVVNAIPSSWTPVKSGVPQGSVLGPTLFLCYINDLSSVVKNSHVKLFADDTKIYKAIAERRDCDALQSDLHQL